MALHYFLLPFKILVLLDVFTEVVFGLFFNQKSLFIKRSVTIYTVLSSALKSFFYALYTCKYTSQYTFVNPYTAIATTEGRGGGGGGGGHGKDDWVIPILDLNPNELQFKKSKNFKFNFI
jgi:hypothetical protein